MVFFHRLLPPKKNYITPSIFRNTGPGLLCRWVWHWSFQPLWLQKAKNLRGAGHGSSRRKRRVRTEHLRGTGNIFLCCCMCPGGTEDALSCLHSFLWPAFDPRSIYIHKYLSHTPGRWGKERKGKEWVYQLWDRCRAWKEIFLLLSSSPTVNLPASKRACLLVFKMNGFCQDSSPVGDLLLRGQWILLPMMPPGRCWLNDLTLGDFTKCCCSFWEENGLRRAYTRNYSSLLTQREPGEFGEQCEDKTRWVVKKDIGKMEIKFSM